MEKPDYNPEIIRPYRTNSEVNQNAKGPVNEDLAD